MTLAGAQPPDSGAAGWYPDPLGGEGTRYFDGSQWTDRVTGGQPGGSHPPNFGSGESGSWWTRLPGWGKWAIGIVGVLVILGVGVAIGGSDSSEKGKREGVERELSRAESQAEDEVSEARAEASEASEKAAEVEAEETRVVSAAESKAAKIIGGAKSEKSEAEAKLSGLRSEVSSAESELASVQSSLEGAETEKALSHFGTGIMKAEVGYIPGTYESEGGEGCYWAKLGSANTQDIQDNEFAPDGGQQIVTIDSPYFQSSNCAEWKRIGE